MADPVRVTGFFSTLDYEAVISQMRAARESVLMKLSAQSGVASAKKTALSAIQAKIASLLDQATKLSLSTSSSGKLAAATGTSVSAVAVPASTVGSFTVDVNQLATNTKLGGSAISAAIDANLPLASSNFYIKPTNGTFTVATATGGSATIKVGAEAAQAGTLLNAANFATTPTSGTFTVTTATGGSAVINVDTATQTLNDVATAITGSGVGITATVTNDANGRANILTLTSTQGTISLGAGGDTSNFLAASNLGTGTALGATWASTAAFTKQMSLNDVVTDINAAGIGVTATVTNDANGRANIVTLTSTQGNISLGNANDTSTFLSATNLLASAAGTTRASTTSVARLNTTDKMNVATFFGGAPAAGAHSFTINGVTINYNAANDSLADVINRINSSTAGVAASYNPVADTVNLQQAKTGSMNITLADDGAGGDLLSKLGLITATQTLGQNAQYQINGGVAQSSVTNTVTLGDGTTLNLLATTAVGSPVTVTVSQDTNSVVSSVKAFVSAFNDAMTTLDLATKADGSKGKNQSGVLSGDASLRALKAQLRSLMSTSAVAPGGNFSTLGQIGLNFGAVGSSVGTTNTLQLDETKFKNALSNDPSSVQALLSVLELTPTLTPGGTSSVTAMSGTYSGTLGTWSLNDSGAGTVTATFTPANGGPATTTQAAVTANSTNTLLVPGMTLTIGALQPGTSTITVAATKRGVMHLFKDFLDTQAGAGGVLQKRQDTYSATTKDLANQQQRVQSNIDAEMDALRRKFQAMEKAQARYQAASNSLTQMMAQWTANAKG